MLELVTLKQVWNRGGHNAFTDLCWFKGFFWLVFREASKHVSNDGRVIVLKSTDGFGWALAAEIIMHGLDLRDPKLVVTSNDQLLMTLAAANWLDKKPSFQSYLYYSDNGQDWSSPYKVGRENEWIWRTRFIDGVAYGVSYNSAEESTSLYQLRGLGDYQLYINDFFSKKSNFLGYPNEHDLFIWGEDELCCLLRRDADSASSQLGRSKPPYKSWHWRDLGVHTGGPVALKLLDGRVLLAVRLLKPERTSLCLLHVELGEVEELMTLPSGGDTSYAGLLEKEGFIYCSYYSSHEANKSSIYVAKLKINAPK